MLGIAWVTVAIAFVTLVVVVVGFVLDHFAP